ncbi:MAG: PorP/SprF family type IX secretion system membrane protein [Bacteroidetes bacterium]|nr:PorP/SprF family type IX secretion system membrane protein [Bacteroidota bacterium]
MNFETPLIFLFFFPALVANAQDVNFSSPSVDQQFLNPAFAGSLACGHADAGLRLQWPKMSGKYTTAYTSYDQYFKFGAIGFNQLHDSEGKGFYVTDRYDFTYSGYIPLLKDSSGKGKLVIQPAFSFGYLSNKVDWNKMVNPDVIDPRNGFPSPVTTEPIQTSKTNVDLSGGILIYSKIFLAGFSACHITRPDIGFLAPAPLNRRYVAHVSVNGNLLLSQNISLPVTLTFIFSQQSGINTWLLNSTFGISKFQFGFGYRVNDALLFSLGYKGEQMRIGYTYDLTTGELKGITGGAHEIHLGILFSKKKWSEDRTNLQNFF